MQLSWTYRRSSTQFWIYSGNCLDRHTGGEKKKLYASTRLRKDACGAPTRAPSICLYQSTSSYHLHREGPHREVTAINTFSWQLRDGWIGLGRSKCVHEEDVHIQYLCGIHQLKFISFFSWGHAIWLCEQNWACGVTYNTVWCTVAYCYVCTYL